MTVKDRIIWGVVAGSDLRLLRVAEAESSFGTLEYLSTFDI